jgi:DNA-binding MarR family transcriptional regulator
MAGTKSHTIAREIEGACLAVRLRALNRALTSVYDDHLRPFGLKTSQLNVLVAIESAGALQPVQLAEALSLEKSTVSRNVDKLAARGWVECAPARRGRGQSLRLTASGRRLLSAVAPAWRSAQERAVEALGDEGAIALRDLHGRLLTQPV